MPHSDGAAITARAPDVPLVWQKALITLGGLWLGLIALFWPDWSAMAGQWWNSSTYNHVLLVPAIIAWLVAQRAPELARLEPRGGWVGGLLLLAGAMLLWLLGAVSGLSIARQAGAVAMLAAAVLSVVGPRAGWGLAFPLGYMIFLVPFGDELVAPLQMLTARLTIGLVQLSGIPATINGVFIATPAGLFEVAEACSGVKFLVAMVAFGVFAANQCFVTRHRRALFLCLCIVAPVLANGVRAWGTVQVAQWVGPERATGFDHIVYGWFFFACVIALVIAVSSRFFDRKPDMPFVDVEGLTHSRLLSRLERQRLPFGPCLAVFAGLVLGGFGWASAAERLEAPLPRQIFLPHVAGWHRVDYAPRVWWEPRASGARHRLLGRYADASGRPVDVFVAVYAAQGEGAEAGGFGEGALQSGQGWDWQSPGRSLPDATADYLRGPGGLSRLAETRFRQGALLTGSNLRLKLVTMTNRLFLRREPTVLVILSAEQDASRGAEAALADFRRAIGPMAPWIDRFTRLP